MMLLTTMFAMFEYTVRHANVWRNTTGFLFQTCFAAPSGKRAFFLPNCGSFPFFFFWGGAGVFLSLFQGTPKGKPQFFAGRLMLHTFHALARLARYIKPLWRARHANGMSHRPGCRLDACVPFWSVPSLLFFRDPGNSRRALSL